MCCDRGVLEDLNCSLHGARHNRMSFVLVLNNEHAHWDMHNWLSNGNQFDGIQIYSDARVHHTEPETDKLSTNDYFRLFRMVNFFLKTLD